MTAGSLCVIYKRAEEIVERKRKTSASREGRGAVRIPAKSSVKDGAHVFKSRENFHLFVVDDT